MASGKIEKHPSSDFFTFRSVSVTASSTAAGATFNTSATIPSVTGYTPYGVAGWSSSGMTYLTMANMAVSSSENQITVSGRNLGTSSVTPSYNVRILYFKDS